MNINSASAEFETPAVKETPFNEKNRRSRLHFFGVLAKTILLQPAAVTAIFTFRSVKLLTYASAKAGIYKISGFHTEASTYLESEYLKTVKAVRNILFIPSAAKRAYSDMVAAREEFIDDIARKPPEQYLKVNHTKNFQQYSSPSHGLATFEVIRPEKITEFLATSDASLKTVMASHIFEPDMMAINFGMPNVAAFVTEEKDDGSIQTVKVDAKSLRRAPMTYHETNGKIQSGVFFVPTNLPPDALTRFKKAAKNLENRNDITCVNTNCRVLKEAGFSIEGVALDKVIFPTMLMDHLLFRNVFFTDAEGKKHKIYFDIINTTNHNLEKHLKMVDTAVVGTRFRHRRRNADTEENKEARSEAAKEMIAEEKKRLAEGASAPLPAGGDQGRREITVSVPSYLGNKISGLWGRHTIYEISLADKKDDISNAFESKLVPFPKKHPDFVTWLKRDIFFSAPIIRLLRRHMIGREEKLHLQPQDLFTHFRSTDGEHLNYVLLDDKIVLARVHANGKTDKKVKKTADWALCKHTLLSNRKKVYCAGEMWYDTSKNRFFLNNDSGSYIPNKERVEQLAQLANRIFQGQAFEVKTVAVTN